MHVLPKVCIWYWVGCIAAANDYWTLYMIWGKQYRSQELETKYVLISLALPPGGGANIPPRLSMTTPVLCAQKTSLIS